MVSTANLNHVNIVIDACNTGGLVNDLGSLLKPEVIGKRGTFGVSILAAAASDEFALEENGQGLMTTSVLNLLSGKKKISSDNEYLDLVTIGRYISAEFKESNQAQSPTFWGFNIFGPTVFAKNPHYIAPTDAGSPKYTYIPPASKLGKILCVSENQLIDCYESIHEAKTPSKLCSILQNIYKNCNNTDDILRTSSDLLDRYLTKASETPHISHLALVNAFTTALMPYISSRGIQDEMKHLREHYLHSSESVWPQLENELNNDKNLLIPSNDGIGVLANYYTLPIRISSILGHIGQSALLSGKLSPICSNLVEALHLHYQSKFVSISDIQAAPLFCFFRSMQKCGSTDTAQKIYIRYLGDFLNNKGCVAKIDIRSNEIFPFVVQRIRQKGISSEYLERPGQLGSVLLSLASEFDQASDLDDVLHLLDKNHFNLFFPSNIIEFGLSKIPHGQNFTQQCGRDFWTVKEFTDNITQTSKTNVMITEALDQNLAQFFIMAASNTHSDRIHLSL